MPSLNAGASSQSHHHRSTESEASGRSRHRFPRGAGLAYDGFAEATGADCIGLDATVPLEWAAQRVQRDLDRGVQGNLDPQLLVAGGPALHAETDRILRALSGGPFVFNLGHGIVRTTPPEHVTALAEQVRCWPTPTRRTSG